MNERRQDFEQLQRFSREGEQTAFADLMRRHLDLVFGTAVRTVGDHGAAQEVAQNVFSVLAEKAWRFAPDDSLPAWLHKTALLQARFWRRGALRRRRREETAAELGTTMNTPEEQAAFADLLPLLDEALLSLRENDRTALLLRFYENQSLREVGAALGAGEEAATKRVQRALEKLTKFFQRRGFKTASAALLAAALEHTATSASAAVATSLVGAAMQTAPPRLAGFKAVLAQLAVLTRPQRAALGGAFAVALLLLCLFLVRSLEAASRPSLAIERTGTDVTIRFTGALQRADQAQGTFRPVPNNGSPMVVPAGAGQEFWRAWLPGIRSIAAGWSHTVALRTDGTLWAWGYNYLGELGIGTFTTNAPFGTDTPQRIGSETNWQSVVAGFSHTIALRSDGTLWAWGRNGEGGCGVVYMAEQLQPVRRRVALKILKPGLDTRQVIARFEAERQALALMDHPNIARVFDAGATEAGRPYFVMELVRGVKITDFSDENELPMRQRLDLFIQVCHAIQHAHQKGVIHRDIKPSNILVTVNDGVPVPKVIDFGIAKATTGQPLTDKTVFTAFEQFLGTPAYMSPEQAVMTSLDIDTRSDIYSLGVLLYELLTGKTPFDSKELLRSGFDEMRRTIREKEPARPSTRLSTMAGGELTTTAKRRHIEAPRLIHLVRGDLDWIVMKCLEKDRARRYETASGLARDVERHLTNEPVLARPPSRWYELQKTFRRHKVGLSTAAAIVLALSVGITLTTRQAFRARRARSASKPACAGRRRHPPGSPANRSDWPRTKRKRPGLPTSKRAPTCGKPTSPRPAPIGSVAGRGGVSTPSRSSLGRAPSARHRNCATKPSPPSHFPTGARSAS